MSRFRNTHFTLRERGCLQLLTFVLVLTPALTSRASDARGQRMLPMIDCSLRSERLILHDRSVQLPAFMQVVIESHLATTDDRFPEGLFPTSPHQRIEIHVKRSCQLLRQILPEANCDRYYANAAAKQWTPPEHGKWGQGSVGRLRPTPISEMWSGNLFWATLRKPRPGTRFLVRRDGRAIVLVMGYETGPSDASKLGVQAEVAEYLGASNGQYVALGRLKDQLAPPGPVQCKH